MTRVDQRLETMPEGVPLRALGVDASGGPVLFGPMTGMKPLSYYHAGGSNYSPAFAAAMSDAENELYVPPSATPYGISSPINIPSYKRISVPVGAKIVANNGFAGEAMVEMDNGGNAVMNAEISGGGILDAQGFADNGINAIDLHRGRIDGLRIFGVNKRGVQMGALAPGAGLNRHANWVGNLEIRRKTGVTAYNPADMSRGVAVGPNCHDSWFSHIEPVGFNVGFSNEGGSNDLTGIHPWTTNYYAPMKYGIWMARPGILTNCYADSPTSLGDGAVGHVYGFFIDAFNVSIIAPNAYLLAENNGQPVCINDEATAIYFNVNSGNGSYCSIIGGRISSSSSAVKWSKDADGANWLRTVNAIAIAGLQNDGNLVTTQVVDNIISPLKTYGVSTFINAAGGATTRKSGMYFDPIAIANLPTAVGNAHVVRTVSDGLSGKWLVKSDGAVWRYADGTAV